MNKNKIKLYNSSLFIVVIISVLLYSCKSNELLTVNTDINYKHKNYVSLEPYKSVQERIGQDSTFTLGVAISGGGSRAQYFGSGVLIGLDEINTNSKKNVLNEVDYFSTVSGGGYGVGYYLTLKRNNLLKTGEYLNFWDSSMHTHTLQDYMYVQAHKISMLKNFSYERNKNGKKRTYLSKIKFQLLQEEKIVKINNNKSDTVSKFLFDDIFINKDSTYKSVNLPMFVTNGTIYNNGDRIPFMPHIIDSLNLLHSLLPKESFKNGYKFPVAYAIAGSAAFPAILPMLKFEISKNKVIRIIDGGANDNLGYKTLLELLKQDKNHDSKKAAIIVNCGGVGIEGNYNKNDKQSILKIAAKGLLYAPDINILDALNEEIYLKAHSLNIDTSKILNIGITSIKDQFNKLKENATYNETIIIKNLRDSMLSEKLYWNDLYLKFVGDTITKFKGCTTYKKDEINISTIQSEIFNSFNLVDAFMLYELSSQVNTKVKIHEKENEILVLAGRYTVFLNRDRIKKIIDTK